MHQDYFYNKLIISLCRSRGACPHACAARVRTCPTYRSTMLYVLRLIISCIMSIITFLFFLWFPLCRGEAGLFVTPMYGYFCNSFPLVPVVGLFSPLFFLLCLSQVSLHTILAVVFLVFCNHRASLSRIFLVISHLSF